jgi:nitrogen regulatory protein PII-like uncharacterized protein
MKFLKLTQYQGNDVYYIPSEKFNEMHIALQNKSTRVYLFSTQTGSCYRNYIVNETPEQIFAQIEKLLESSSIIVDMVYTNTVEDIQGQRKVENQVNLL